MKRWEEEEDPTQKQNNNKNKKRERVMVMDVEAIVLEISCCIGSEQDTEQVEAIVGPGFMLRTSFAEMAMRPSRSHHHTLLLENPMHAVDPSSPFLSCDLSSDPQGAGFSSSSSSLVFTTS